MPSESTDGIQQSLSNESFVNCNNNGKSDNKSESDGMKFKESQLHDDIIPLGQSTNKINDREDEKITSCGWIGIKPKCLQKFRTPRWLLFWLCWAGALQVCNNTLKELNF
jgi:hypothetical protein